MVEHHNQGTQTTAALVGEDNCCTWVDSAPGTAGSIFAGPGRSDDEQAQALAQAENPCPRWEGEPRGGTGAAPRPRPRPLGGAAPDAICTISAYEGRLPPTLSNEI